jgi:hypothetical protein
MSNNYLSTKMKKRFISPAFAHAKLSKLFGTVNKDGKERVLEPYQVRTLDEYIDFDNLNQELRQSQTSLGIIQTY